LLAAQNDLSGEARKIVERSRRPYFEVEDRRSLSDILHFRHARFSILDHHQRR
jgi:hypothetical protein